MLTVLWKNKLDCARTLFVVAVVVRFLLVTTVFSRTIVSWLVDVAKVQLTFAIYLANQGYSVVKHRCNLDPKCKGIFRRFPS